LLYQKLPHLLLGDACCTLLALRQVASAAVATYSTWQTILTAIKQRHDELWIIWVR
jgi:hypothetical protein